MADDCIFCKVINSEFDSAKIWENENFLAFLDLNPNAKGMTLVIPKKHFDSDTFLMPKKDYQELMLAARKVSKILRKGLPVNRVAMVAEGMGVNHAHIKLYPLYGTEKEFKETWEKEKVFFEEYQGYISTQQGPQKELEELKKLAKEIKKAAR
jgi:diadenosine tetraphosphate (Ap4A) HIT family hydrolase